MITIYEVRGTERLEDDPYYEIDSHYGLYTTRTAAMSAVEEANKNGYGYNYDVYEVPVFNSSVEEANYNRKCEEAAKRRMNKAERNERRRKAKRINKQF